jgi:hypothetical protein
MFRENSEYVKKLNEIDFERAIGDELMHQNYIRPELRVVK